jgi:hypothetical protein
VPVASSDDDGDSVCGGLLLIYYVAAGQVAEHERDRERVGLT